ncbi:MAG: DUF1566 domain-containing protein [Sulfurimonadaceae bacterium]
MRSTFLLSLIAFTFIGCGSTETTGAITEDGTTDTTWDVNNSYNIVDTAQTLCYDSATGLQSACTNRGYDADYDGNQTSYTVSPEGGIVTDNVTGLMWTQSTDTDGDGVTTDIDDKKSPSGAVTYCSNLTLEGYDDWRLPDVKTLYSLILFTGEDPSGYTGTDTSLLETFLDASFSRSFGDLVNGERIIDGQYATTSLYVSTTMNGDATMFGVNFVDGRIKGYPTSSQFYVNCVRGNEDYGLNNYSDNGDSTISDTATSLMWEQNSSNSTDWDDAVASCEASTTGSWTDWRLPNVKELHSLVDYSRSPDTTNSAAIDPIFNATSFINEEGENDWGSYWSSTTHVNSNGYGDSAAYVSFGRALGYMSPNILDVHGAGAQRSDGKVAYSVGSSTEIAYDGSLFYYKGPQGDIQRLDNKVRCVRDNVNH